MVRVRKVGAGRNSRSVEDVDVARRAYVFISAGAIVEGGTGLAADKIRALENAGVKVAKHPEEIPSLFQPYS